MTDYRYIGDRFTDRELKGKTCSAVRRPDGKCIRGKNGSMLVSFDGKPVPDNYELIIITDRDKFWNPTEAVFRPLPGY